ncbi:hypothetical protein MBANPS3_011679 [Mucor bainieri]
MERIESNFEKYQRETNLVTRLKKTHFLVHLDDDMKRFATAIRQETEKGEQFNKEIHDAIRHYPNRDIAHIFAQKTLFLHLSYDGAFNDDERIGAHLIKAYMKTKEYRECFMGVDTEFQDNNYATSRILRLNGSGVYLISEGGVERTAVGTIKFMTRTMVQIELADFVYRNDARHESSLSEACLRNSGNCPLMRYTGSRVTIPRAAITRFEVLDLATSETINGQKYQLLNKNNFGTVCYRRITQAFTLIAS